MSTTITTDEGVTVEVETFTKITPTRRRIDVTAHEGPERLYVTQNEAGKFRAALAGDDFEIVFGVGETFEAKHSKRSTKYGTLKVVAVKHDGVVEGELPENAKSLPLRMLG